ncbi:hypothetical protein [Roseateles asaccharophilus]|uniref:Uncharacterized protein n=1 Tax=Roseateles asaccharophilus TaxID=582607 RepID=A0ABU2A5E5_9BURK|nr:hypothetical protein [Roseateles asaccharophilus]MDR7332422.1 hypothetical protein [Roseateles asaccharophilus]
MAASRLVMLPPAALLLGVALVAWAWWGQAPMEVALPAPAPAATLARATAPAPPDAPAPAARPNAMQPLPATTGLTALLAAPEADLRASLHAALAARAQGGRLYARALARRCAAVAGLAPPEQAPDVNHPLHQRAVARQAALSAGCAQFPNAEWLGFVNVAADEAAGDDPLLTLQQSDLDDAALLQAVFARPDALLLDELGERLLLRRIAGEPVLYFDGQRFDTEADRALAQSALRLLPCEFGLTCDERDPEVWLACLRGDGCAASRAAQEPAAALGLAQRLAAALRGRELQRFLPPS